MDMIIKNIRFSLNSGLYNLSVIERETEVSRNYMKKIMANEKVPAYVIVALDTFFKNLGKQYG